VTDPALIALADILDPPAWQAPDRPPLEPHQVPPPGDWTLWLLLAGRSAGKTEACSRYFTAWMRAHPGHRGRIIGPTFGDVVEACIEGPSGLKSVDPEVRWLPSAPGGAKVIWPNGSEALCIGTHKPQDVDRLRAGGNRHIDWWEEMAANPQLDKAWTQAQFGLRLGLRPHSIASTTPRNRAKLRELIAKPTTSTVRASTFDNPHNPKHVVDEWRHEYEGTRIGRQELYGELLEDVPGALWKREWIRHAEPPDDMRVVVGVDPAVTSGEGSSLTGIVVAGHSVHFGRSWILADLSLRATPDEWSALAVRAFHEYEASAIVAEVNNGGDLVSTVIRHVDPEVPVRQVRASRGKLIRAEPVAVKYEQQRVFHAIPMPDLEDQMCSYTHDTKDSPDRMDAMVWAMWDLVISGGRQAATVNRAGTSPEPVVRRGDLVLRGEQYVDKDPTRR